MHGNGPPSIDINVVGAKGRHFKLKSIFDHNNHAEMRANRVGAWKNFLHQLRSRVGRDVDVLRRFAADNIAHTTSGEVGDVTALAQTRSNFARCLFHRGSCFHSL